MYQDFICYIHGRKDLVYKYTIGINNFSAEKQHLINSVRKR